MNMIVYLLWSADIDDHYSSVRFRYGLGYYCYHFWSWFW